MIDPEESGAVEGHDTGPGASPAGPPTRPAPWMPLEDTTAAQRRDIRLNALAVRLQAHFTAEAAQLARDKTLETLHFVTWEREIRRAPRDR